MARVPPQLSGYEVFPFTAQGWKHFVYRTGAAADPPVLVLCEVAGFSPGLLAFVDRLAQAGFQVFVPWLFGLFGRRAPVRNLSRLCVSREFGYLRSGITSPVADWLRALAGEMSERNHGCRVGAIGMCLTGALAIPLILDPHVKAAVAAQPAIPCSIRFALLGIRASRAMHELNIAAADVAAARRRLNAGEAHLLAVRARADRICPAEKMERLRREFPVGLTIREYGEETSRNSLGERPHALFTKESRIAPGAQSGHWAYDAFTDLTVFLRLHLEEKRSDEFARER